LTPEQKAAIQATHDRIDTSFDNHNIHSQVDYLARAYASVGDNAWRDACLRGLDFMLLAQLEDGGFPQRYPDPTEYAAHITFNDGVTIGILNVLKDAGDDMPHWKWLDLSDGGMRKGPWHVASNAFSSARFRPAGFAPVGASNTMRKRSRLPAPVRSSWPRAALKKRPRLSVS
jgi:hypothetical protein